MKPSEVSRRRAQHLCLFGDPKTGKSTLVSELLLHGYNLTWISMDNGHEVLFKLPLSMEKMDAQLNLIIVPDTKDFTVAVSTCHKIISGKECFICDAHGQVDCSTCRSKKDEATWSRVCLNEFGAKDIIVFDHIQQLAVSTINAVRNKAKMKDDEKNEWDQYAVQGTMMDRFLTNVQQAAYHVICITHVCETEMDDGSKKLVPLVGTTNFSRNAGKYFDHLVYSRILNSDHKFGSSTKYVNKVVTGSRSDIMIEDEKKPSLKKFFDGTIPEPELAGASAARKVLTTSQKVESIVSEVPAPKIEITKETIDEEMRSMLDAMAKASQDNSPKSIPEEIKKNIEQQQPTSKPTMDRAALLASLKRGNR